MLPNTRLANFIRRHLPADKKAVALIIVIFAMMIFAVLGWTLTVMQSTDFEANLRNFDSERTLDLAEAGAQWGFQSLKTDFDCSNFNPTGSPPGILHSLGAGQYRVSCTCTDNPPQCNNSTQLILQSTGYIPSELIFRAQRQIRVVVDQGAFATAGSVRNLFDWSGMTSGAIDGKLQAGCFDGPDAGSSCPGTPNVDFGTNLPPGTGQRIQDTTTIPPINMGNFKSKAQSYGGGKNYFVCKTGTALNSSEGYVVKVSTNNFFDGLAGEAVRNLGPGHGTWNDSDWAVIVSVSGNKKEATLDRNIADDWKGDDFRIVKYFSDQHNEEKLWYIDATDKFGNDIVNGNVLIDARDSGLGAPGKNAKLEHTSIVAEGDIVILGTKKVTMKAFVETSNNETFPNLATQAGNIYSNVTPSAGGDGRKFDGLIYTLDGDVEFNCIDGVAIMGKNVKVYGEVDLEYDAKYVDTDGFFGSISKISWQEQ